MTFGEELKKSREEKKLSQEDLAEQIGVSRQAISKWESDQSIPRGSNRRILCQLLSLENSEEKCATKRTPKLIAYLGWAVAIALLITLSINMARESKMKTGAVVESNLYSITFYDEHQDEILPEALWYNTASIESILIQWSGEEPPVTVKMFFTPAGSETADQTELIGVKSPTGGYAVLMPTDALHSEGLSGHLYFELDFGGGNTISSAELYEDVFNVFYDSALVTP